MTQINIVGSIANIEEINEIETVAKAFAIAERMIDITIEPEEINKEKIKEPTKKKKLKNKTIINNFQILKVRGFN